MLMSITLAGRVAQKCHLARRFGGCHVVREWCRGASERRADVKVRMVGRRSIDVCSK